MLIYCVVLWVAISFFRMHYRWAFWFWAASLLTFPLWIWGPESAIRDSDLGGSWFLWAKILSVLVPLTVVGLCRIAVVDLNSGKKSGKFWEFLAGKNFLWFFYAVLFLNIFEATVSDALHGNPWNALTGFILCATIPFVPKFWTWSQDRNAELIAYTTVAWNFVYTTWNMCFVWQEGGERVAANFCILIVAELYPLVKKRPELYIMARIYTLAIQVLIDGCYNIFPYVMDSSSWYNPTVWKYWGIVNACIAVPFLFWHMWYLDSGRSRVVFRRGPARQEYLAQHPEADVHMENEDIVTVLTPDPEPKAEKAAKDSASKK